MLRVLVFFLGVSYVGCAIAGVGGHYVHILLVLALAVWVYSLFKGKSTGVEIESDV